MSRSSCPAGALSLRRRTTGSRIDEARRPGARVALAKLFALLGAVALITACSAAAPPAPLSPPIPGDPLDLSAYARDPCALLPAAQLTRFYITRPGTASAGIDGPTCSWTPSDTSALTYRASVGAGGLDKVYRRRTSFSVFDVTTVHSYPAVHVETVAGHCRVVVGVTDSMVLDVVTDARDAKLNAYGDPCAEADTFAGAVLGYQGHRAP
ncbi:DUF3558 domain-containing protein [Amycolatopsis vastitatis]|uniref:DUF3558 domain-containing protein n=1 Tax=Amycolatopsis vastitatis TaxID=1905142 RepID=UPI001304552D|nr:DUF3558 domain-containing protein [Amycolatopsis vastitatis]